MLEDVIASVFAEKTIGNSDPFWRNSSSSLFRGICALIWENGEKLSLPLILKYMAGLCVDEYDERHSPLYKDLDSLSKDSVALRNLSAFRSGASGTRQNVLATFNAYMTCFSARDDIVEMMSVEGGVDFSSLGETPTVLYISTPDDTMALGALQGILLTQLMQELNDCALKNGGCLPVRTELYLDELCNIHPAIPSLETALTISRSRGMRYIIAIQSYSQLMGVYGSAADTIASNCSTWISLNISKDGQFREKLSQLCGMNVCGEPLIRPSKLALLKYEEGIVIRERMAPYFTRFEDLSKVEQRLSENSRYATVFGPAKSFGANPQRQDHAEVINDTDAEKKRLAYKAEVKARKAEYQKKHSSDNEDDEFSFEDFDFDDLDLEELSLDDLEPLDEPVSEDSSSDETKADPPQGTGSQTAA